MANDLDAKNEIAEAQVEIADAKQDLRDALHEINHRVEKGVARLRPDRGIRKHPVTSATCIAGALGFVLGSDTAEVAPSTDCYSWVAAIVVSPMKRKAADSGGIKPV